MEFLGVGGLEFALVIIIALIVAGPARMAVWARTAGRWVAKMRQLWSVTAAQLQRELDDAGVDFRVPKNIPTRKELIQEVARSKTFQELTKPVEEVQAALQETRTSLQETRTAVASEIKDVNTTIREAMRAKAQQKAEMKPDPTPEPLANGGTDGFGTWGGGQSAMPTDLGTWNGTAAEKEQS